ncbi:MAG: GtrA family protein [Ruminococcus sp.]|jgi:putative flippase GtrA|nr:GtrA family protein [Ruminococcus sp.]
MSKKDDVKDGEKQGLNGLIRKIVGIFPKPLQELYYKHEKILLYIFYGGLTTLVSFAMQFIPAFLGAPVWASTTISWVSAVTFAFFVNKFFVFDSHDRTAKVILREAGEFTAARLLSFFLELGYLILMVDILGFGLVSNKIIIQIVILILNFLFSKFIIFKKK